MKTGIDLIRIERERQITEERWTAEHDDSHTGGELAGAAVCYALQSIERRGLNQGVYTWWPWRRKDWKPCLADPIRDLVKAGALIAAEIDRMQRLKARQAIAKAKGGV